MNWEKGYIDNQQYGRSIEAFNQIKNMMNRANEPLSEDQEMLLVGALYVWLDNAYKEGMEKQWKK